jgi:hypothetical protein
MRELGATPGGSFTDKAAAQAPKTRKAGPEGPACIVLVDIYSACFANSAVFSS